ncbi:LCP family protein [Streptomyces boninensis]|uniref:LCP family glycopolymer transferase n=1 Tax=Streptomyces boninensis TaxID=2039455 RepID=UPI003B21F8DF
MRGRHARQREPRGHWLLMLTILPLVFAAVLFEGWTTHQVEDPGSRQACTRPAAKSVDDGGPVRAYEHGRQVSDTAPPGTMALSVDGGPDPTWTPRILDLLKQHNAHATFFVHGAQAAQHPYLLRKIRAAGHEIGSLTYTGAPLGTTSALRSSMELGLAQKALAGATGYHTGLLRLPQSSAIDTLCGAEGKAAMRLTEDGYTVVASDKWYRDDETGVVRQFSQTENGFAQAEKLLKARGVDHFETVTKATGRKSTDERASSVEIWQGMALIAVRNVSHAFTDAMGWLLGLTIGLALLRLGLLWFWARTHVRRLGRFRPGSPWLREVNEPVTVLVPAHNEEAGIQSTLRSLLAATHQQLQIIVIDDGSEDRTSELAAELGDPRVLVVKQPNSGKAAALNTGLSYAESEIVVMVDGDTVLEPEAIERLIQPLAHPAIGAVSGNTKVGNRKRLLGRWQHLEYVCGFNLDRRMFDVLECITTVPGAIGAFRRDALIGVGGVSDDTLAEDTDLTMALWRGGWRVVYEETAVAWTEVPTTLRQLWRQRYRWCYGTLQAMAKHRHAIREVGAAGRFARRGLTYISVFQVALPLFTPLLDVFALYGLLFGNPLKAASVWLLFMGAQIAIAGYALKLDGERLRTLWSLPLQLFTYRLLMYLVVIQSMVTVLSGITLNWGRMKRSGSAADAIGGVEVTQPEERVKERETVAVHGSEGLSGGRRGSEGPSGEGSDGTGRRGARRRGGGSGRRSAGRRGERRRGAGRRGAESPGAEQPADGRGAPMPAGAASMHPDPGHLAHGTDHLAEGIIHPPGGGAPYVGGGVVHPAGQSGPMARSEVYPPGGGGPYMAGGADHPAVQTGHLAGGESYGPAGTHLAGSGAYPLGDPSAPIRGEAYPPGGGAHQAESNAHSPGGAAHLSAGGGVYRLGGSAHASGGAVHPPSGGLQMPADGAHLPGRPGAAVPAPHGAPGAPRTPWSPDGTVILTRTAPATPLPPEDHFGGDPDAQPAEPPEARRRRRRRIRRRLLAVIACLALLSPLGAYGWADSKLNRGLDLDKVNDRPLPGEGTNYLIVGSDSRAGLSREDREKLHTGDPVGRRTDSMMLVHTGKHGTTMTSLPRDSWSDMPSFIRPENGKQYGAEHNKLNAAFSYGGAPFLVKTIERNTGLRIDHYAEVGFAGFVNIVDAVGGVRMCLDRPVKDENSGADLKKGCQVLDGAQGLSFVRQRHQEAEGDLGRAKNQQKFLSALAHQAASKKTLMSPGKVRGIVEAALGSVIVDQDTDIPDLVRMAQAVQKVSQGKGRQVQIPIADKYHWTDKGSSVLWDRKRAKDLFERMRKDEPIPAERPAK